MHSLSHSANLTIHPSIYPPSFGNFRPLNPWRWRHCIPWKHQES